MTKGTKRTRGGGKSLERDPTSDLICSPTFVLGCVPALLVLSMLLTGCQRATTPGSAYLQTDRIVDLLTEPTFDVGADPASAYFYSFNVPHSDADGHSLFDVPMVISEQLFFAPSWLFSWPLRLTGSEAFLGAPGPGGVAGTLQKGAGWVFGVPGAAFYLMGLTGAMGFDLVAHDVPVILIGRPIRWLAEQAY